MRYLLTAIWLAALLFVSACRKTTVEAVSSTVSLRLDAQYGDEPFYKNKELNYDGQSTLAIQKLSFLLSDLSLIKEDGKSVVHLSDLEFFDICGLKKSINDQNKYWQKTYYAVPAGNYRGLRFHLGINPEYNALMPKDFAPGHLLARDSLYDEDRQSYIFEQIKGTITKNTAHEFDVKVLTDQNFLEVSVLKSIEITDTTYALQLHLDIAKLFEKGGTRLDLASNPAPATESPAIDTLLTGFSKAFSIE